MNPFLISSAGDIAAAAITALGAWLVTSGKLTPEQSSTMVPIVTAKLLSWGALFGPAIVNARRRYRASLRELALQQLPAGASEADIEIKIIALGIRDLFGRSRRDAMQRQLDGLQALYDGIEKWRRELEAERAKSSATPVVAGTTAAVLLVLALWAGAASAQTTTGPIPQATPVASLPATCTPGVGRYIVFLTVGDIDTYQCKATNTWSKIGAGLGASSDGATGNVQRSDGSGGFVGSSAFTFDGNLLRIVPATGQTETLIKADGYANNRIDYDNTDQDHAGQFVTSIQDSWKFGIGMLGSNSGGRGVMADFAVYNYVTGTSPLNIASTDNATTWVVPTFGISGLLTATSADIVELYHDDAIAHGWYGFGGDGASVFGRYTEDFGDYSGFETGSVDALNVNAIIYGVHQDVGYTQIRINDSVLPDGMIFSTPSHTGILKIADDGFVTVNLGDTDDSVIRGFQVETHGNSGYAGGFRVEPYSIGVNLYGVTDGVVNRDVGITLQSYGPNSVASMSVNDGNNNVGYLSMGQSSAVRLASGLAEAYTIGFDGSSVFNTPLHPTILTLSDDATDAVVGSELLTNTSFADDTNWTLGTGWSIAGGNAIHVPGADSLLTQTIGGLVPGHVYDVTVGFNGGISNNGYLYAWVGTENDYTTYSTLTGGGNTLTVRMLASDPATMYVVEAEADFQGNIVSVSVKEVTGVRIGIVATAPLSASELASNTQFATNNTPLGTTGDPTVDVFGTPGSTTYGYRLVGRNRVGTAIASSEVTVSNGNATLDGSNYNAIAVPSQAGYVSYDVYRTTGGATSGLIGTAVAGDGLLDTGLSGNGATSLGLDQFFVFDQSVGTQLTEGSSAKNDYARGYSVWGPLNGLQQMAFKDDGTTFSFYQSSAKLEDYGAFQLQRNGDGVLGYFYATDGAFNYAGFDIGAGTTVVFYTPGGSLTLGLDGNTVASGTMTATDFKLPGSGQLNAVNNLTILSQNGDITLNADGTIQVQSNINSSSNMDMAGYVHANSSQVDGLAGAGNSFLCADASGNIYRCVTP